MKDKEWLVKEVDRLRLENTLSNNPMMISNRDVIAKVSRLIDQLDEPEITVIPQKIADFIEKYKGKSHSLAYAINSTEVIKWFSEKNRDEWLYSNERENLFARAWLDGYEVEKEKLYRVRVGKSYVRFNLDGSIIGAKAVNSVVTLDHLSKLPFDYKKAVESGIITLVEVT